MKKYFITYGDEKYEKSKLRIVKQAESLNLFDKIIAYNPTVLTQRTKESSIMRISRGGGLWIWKPDIIYQTLETMSDGDYLFYCDAGCTLQKSKEWNKYFSILSDYDICALKIFNKNINWTRKEIIDFFCKCNGNWLHKRQCCATIIIIKSDFTMKFVKEWLDTMIMHPEFVEDVKEEQMKKQLPEFIENRHDQSVYSALIYKYIYTGKIKIIWEHIEGYDYFNKQAILASRLRNGEIKAHYGVSNLIKIISKKVIRLFCQ